MTIERSFLAESKYESPQLKVLEIGFEGVLCQSGIVEEWEEDELEW